MNMMIRVLIGTLMLSISPLGLSETTPPAQNPAQKPAANTQVLMQTTLGDIVIEVYDDSAPITAKNFIQYVRKGFYDGIIFHRVLPGFVIQGGGFDTNYARKATDAPIENESNSKLKNKRGTLSMARLPSPNSATSQFFINLVDNISLNWMPARPGYAVFGHVTQGIEVVDAIAKAPQGSHTGTFVNAPNDPIIISKATVLPPAKLSAENAAVESPSKGNQATPSPKAQ